MAAARGDQTSSEAEESGEELLDDESYGESYDESCDEEAEEDYDEDGERSIASGSFVKVRRGRMGETQDDIIPEEREDGPDYYTIDVVAWDTPCSALHFAIISGHEAVVNLLCRVCPPHTPPNGLEAAMFATDCYLPSRNTGRIFSYLSSSINRRRSQFRPSLRLC